jgi:hypothetical protein
MKKFAEDLFSLLMEEWPIVIPSALIMAWCIWALVSAIAGYRRRRKLPKPLRYGRDPD